MKELYVVNCCRTAVGSFGGSLKNTPAAQLGSIVVKEALKRANVAPENVDELIVCNILEYDVFVVKCIDSVLTILVGS